MNAAKKCLCALPPLLKNVCDYGCVYREPAFKHIACKIVAKTECAAPCYPEPCQCKNPKNGRTELTIKKLNEVCIV